MRHCCKTFRRVVYVAHINPASVATESQNHTQYAYQAHAHPKITDKKILRHLTKLQVSYTMHNANLYQQSNSIQKRDALDCLQEYAPKIKWRKNNNRIIDIGCGDGTVTNMLKKYIPTSFKLLGSDTSESMVDFANKHHCNEQTSFTVLDIAGVLPEGMKGNFDHVFSFYVLHWVIDQKRAFKNIFDLLDEEGDCFMIFLACNPIYDIYRLLARNNKWSAWLKDVEKYISPYHDSKEPDKEVAKLMEDIGFVNIDVECKDMVFMYDSVDTVRKSVTAVNPFKIPKDKYDEFLEDYVQALHDIKLIDDVNNESLNVKFNYKLLIVYGNKCSNKKIPDLGED